MYRIILFLVLIALAAAGAAWIADQTGDVVLSSGGWRVENLAAGIRAGARRHRRRGDAGVGRSCAGLWRTPQRIKRARRERRHARGRHAITHGPARDRPRRFPQRPRLHADVARAAMQRTIRWRCCCTRNRHSSTATAKGARAAFRAMAERGDTRLLGLARSVHRSAARRRSGRRRHDCRRSAEIGAGIEPGRRMRLLGFRCAKADWSGALSILDNNLASGLIDKGRLSAVRRGVLLTARRALELETVDRDLSRGKA